MANFDEPVLWRLSTFERMRAQGGTSVFQSAEGSTVLPTTLLSDLARLEYSDSPGDVLEVFASCLRHRESALVYVRHNGFVWPVTVFPREHTYHCPHDLVVAAGNDMRDMAMLAVDPPGVRPPGHAMTERVAAADRYHSLLPLLWHLALYGPRSTLLREVAGTAAYRIAPGFVLGSLPTPGALQPAYQNLRREPVALKHMAQWPGLNVERASRLVNALYMVGGLLVSHTHPAARSEPGTVTRSWRNLFRPRR